MSDNISRQSALDALKAIRHGLWEIDIPSPAGCPEYVEHHEQIKHMMGVVDGWIKKISEEESTDRTGHWKIYDHVDRIGRVIGEKICVCDQCKETVTLSWRAKVPNFCQHCGADMRGGEVE